MAEALSKVNEYSYRKEFGLSKEEYLAEPLEDILINSHIMSTVNEMEKEKMKEAERKSTS